MKYKPSRLELFIATLPKELAMIALKAVAEEEDRWNRQDYTKEEKEMFANAKILGQSARETYNKIVLKELYKQR